MSSSNSPQDSPPHPVHIPEFRGLAAWAMLQTETEVLPLKIARGRPRCLRQGLMGFVEGRRLGGRPTPGSAAALSHRLHSSVQSVRCWNPDENPDGIAHGAIFNFDFSADGSLLGAACENRSILIFDSHNGKLIKSRTEAHTDCVNCVRFLDQRTFVTCSDDTTVALWDVRNLSSKVQCLRGHSNWVKNIEYQKESGCLITSGFDGSIYTWDINRTFGSSGENAKFNRVYSTTGLIRSRLSPDGTKLIIASCHGYLMVIHDLDLDALHDDLLGFKARNYRLMQLNRMPHRGYLHHHLFKRDRNRVELITDFPADDCAGMISSLEVHPQGWCVASRNTSEDENTEWTCVHDIQDVPTNDAGKATVKQNAPSPTSADLPQTDRPCPSTPRKRRRLSTASHPINRDDATLVSGGQASSSFYVSTPTPLSRRARHEASRNHSADRSSSDLPCTDASESIHQNIPRLSHYAEEPNVGQGFIKEIAFNNDGRLLASPFGFGVRLLAFDSSCNEICDIHTQVPCRMYEVASNMSHTKEVVTTKFSPTDCLLVTGCLNGKVGFHQPVL